MNNDLNDLPTKFPCPTCAELKKIKISKKDKPYYFCDYCGVQVFIRGKIGINNLIEINYSKILNNISTKNVSSGYYELIKLRAQITFIQNKIAEFENKDWFSGLNEHEIEALDHLRAKLGELEIQYSEKSNKL